MQAIHRCKESWTKQEQLLHNNLQEHPVKILQIGEGNFLRGFFDWMIHECKKQGLYDGTIVVTQPRPGGKAKIEAIAEQNGVYTLVTRGLKKGEIVDQKDIITVFSQAFDPYEQWSRLLDLARTESLEVVVSNTTEAGLAYTAEMMQENEPVHSYPGRLTRILYERFKAFDGDPDKGLICLPCELSDRNGDKLKEYVLKYSTDWGYPRSFMHWIEQHNQFLNNLVDRIVTGYPSQEQAEQWFKEWGYKDSQLTTAEPYHLWAIEADPALEQKLPLRAAGLNVHWVADLTPFQERKVRILNGAHTLMTPFAILHGKNYVRETMEDKNCSIFVKDTVEHEIIPMLNMDKQELLQYAAAVYERFLNPYINHRLHDIAMNTLSKFETRLFPIIRSYLEQMKTLPPGLVQGIAAMVRYYQIEYQDGVYLGTTLAGVLYEVRDDEAKLKRMAEIWEDRKSGDKKLEDICAKVLGSSQIWGDLWQGIDQPIIQKIANAVKEMECDYNG